MSIKISPISPKDMTSAAECIQIAFDNDPYNIWAFDKSRFDKKRNLASLIAKCEWGIKNALFFVAKDESSPTPDKVVGVGMWMKPSPKSEPESWSMYLDGWILWLKQSYNLVRYLGRGGLRTQRYWIWKERQAEAQAEVWTDPMGYYFCNIVTVLPEYQGKRIGKQLFEIVTRRADEEGRRCYLESSRLVPNVKIYQTMGFEVAKKMECEEGGDVCELYCMIRDPKKATSAT